MTTPDGETAERGEGPVYALLSGTFFALILVLVLAAYTYKYRGNSKLEGFQSWTFNWWRRCSYSQCSCICCPDEDHDGPHGNHVDENRIEDLVTVSEVIRHEENHLRSSVARSLGIINCEQSPMWLDRQMLHFNSELGKGWFGFVLRGTFLNLSTTFEHNYNYEELKTPMAEIRREPDVVVVQQLREEAKVSERNIFLEDSRAAALVGSATAAERHPNILSLVGFCLDKPPFLMVYEYCSHGDLKTFLRANRDKVEQFEEENLILRFCRDVTSGLLFLHKSNCIPNDLAARTCQVDHFYNIKIGDYGISRSMYPGDYLSCDLSTTLGFTSSVMSFAHRSSYLPLRWMAPELLAELHQNRSPVDSLWLRTSPSASIWSLGITLWEICSMGDVPFARIFDHQFFLVMSSGNLPEDLNVGKGQRPGLTYVQGDSADAIYDVIDMCLKFDPELRTNCTRVENYFTDLYQCQTQTERFREELI